MSVLRRPSPARRALRVPPDPVASRRATAIRRDLAARGRVGLRPRARRRRRRPRRRRRQATRWPWADLRCGRAGRAAPCWSTATTTCRRVAPLEAWHSPPVRARRCATATSTRAAPPTTRATSTPLLHVACDLARAGELPRARARCVSEGEEEIGGDSRASLARRRTARPTTPRSSSTAAWWTRPARADDRRARHHAPATRRVRTGAATCTPACTAARR